MLDVRKLRLLRELALRGTLAEVAAALNFSPSAVSQQLSALEKEAGVALLSKAGRRVQLTPQAEILVARTTELLDVLERTESDLAASLSTVTGTVRVAVFQSAALALLLAAAEPGIRPGMKDGDLGPRPGKRRLELHRADTLDEGPSGAAATPP